jgi:transcriptional regulator with XRE-family HTH domain
MPENAIPEPIGRRIARLRQDLGLTQQVLAERLAISRVALSHIEAGLTTPGERTITLLAGVFKHSPVKLVAGSDYPAAKAERLPLSVAWYTPLEMALALLESDLAWLDRVSDKGLAQEVCAAWRERLANIEASWFEERRLLEAARKNLRRRCQGAR